MGERLWEGGKCAVAVPRQRPHPIRRGERACGLQAVERRREERGARRGASGVEGGGEGGGDGSGRHAGGRDGWRECTRGKHHQLGVLVDGQSREAASLPLRTWIARTH